MCYQSAKHVLNIHSIIYIFKIYILKFVVSLNETDFSIYLFILVIDKHFITNGSQKNKVYLQTS